MSTGQLQSPDRVCRGLMADVDDLHRRVFLLEAMLAQVPEQLREAVQRFVGIVHSRLAGAEFAEAEEAREFLRATRRALEQVTALKH
jgi:selenocysteine lyase/cysteine desulfurase